ADRRGMNLERVLRDDRARPDAAHQLVLGDELAGRSCQHFDHLESPPANRNGGAENPKLATREINLAIAGSVDRSGMRRGVHSLQDLPEIRHPSLASLARLA